MTAPDLPVYIDQSIRYTDYLSITLTALAVMLAILAIGIAVLAWWGYREMINSAAEAGRRAAQEEAQRHLESASFKDWLLKQVTGKPPQIDGSESISTDNKIGKEYPEKRGE